MACHKLCLAVACLTAVLTLVPYATAIPTGLLSVLADQSICESVVAYDEDPNRIPRIIKEVKCAASPDKMCPARDGSGSQLSCCKQNSYLNSLFSCQEVIDTVLVSDTTGATSQKTVSIGCACAMKQSISAVDV